MEATSSANNNDYNGRFPRYVMLSPSLDTAFSSRIFIYSKKFTKAEFGVQCTGWSNVRLPFEFKKKFKVFLSFSARSYFGVGKADVLEIGFPGFTNKAWMFCTDGGSYHNSAVLLQVFATSPNEIFMFKCDPETGRIAIKSAAGKKKINCNIPNSVYFYVSLDTSAVKIESVCVEES
jgi:hypothetical protein